MISKHVHDQLVPQRTRVWSPKEVPVGVAITVLGLWAAVVPLIGPYFSFGFDTGASWVFSEQHVTLSLIPGIGAVVGGLILATPARGLSNLGRLLAALCGLWLLIGVSLHQVWDGGLAPRTTEDWKRALLWIAYFYGVGFLITYLAGIARGLITLRQRVQETQVAEPQFERTVTEG
jgi:hypothetical protein